MTYQKFFQAIFFLQVLRNPTRKPSPTHSYICDVPFGSVSDSLPLLQGDFLSVSLMDLEEGSLQFAGFNVVGCLSCCRRMNQEGVIDLIWIGYALSEGMRGFFNWRAR